MSRETKLRLQIFSGIGFATLITLVSAIIYFNRLSYLLEQNASIIAHTEEQISKANQLEPLMYEVLKYKIDQSKNPQLSNTGEYRTVLNEVDRCLVALHHIATLEQTRFPIILKSLQKLEAAANDIINLPIQGTDTEMHEQMIGMQFTFRSQAHLFIDSLLASRETLIESNKKSIESLKDLTILSIALALAIYLYTFIKIYQSSKYLRKSILEIRRINADYLTITEKMEMTNWSLQTNASIIERLSGINEEEKICEIVMDEFKKAMPVAAAAIYVRPFATETFLRYAHTGLDTEESPKSFLEGEGFLGKVVADKTP